MKTLYGNTPGAATIVLALLIVTPILHASSLSSFAPSRDHPAFERNDAAPLAAVVRENSGIPIGASLRDNRDNRNSDGGAFVHAFAILDALSFSETLRGERFQFFDSLLIPKLHLRHPVSRGPPARF